MEKLSYNYNNVTSLLWTEWSFEVSISESVGTVKQLLAADLM